MCPFSPWSPSSQSSRCCPSLLCHLHLHQPNGKLFGAPWPVMKTFLLTEPNVKYGKIDKSRTFTRSDKTQDPTHHNIIKIHLCSECRVLYSSNPFWCVGKKFSSVFVPADTANIHIDALRTSSSLLIFTLWLSSTIAWTGEVTMPVMTGSHSSHDERKAGPTQSQNIQIIK